MAWVSVMTHSGVLSLRCPACGRLFLSLPQQPGALMTCPHCAHSAVIEAFQDGASSPQGLASMTVKRRSPRPPAPITSPMGVPTVSAPVQASPPAVTGFPSSWPPAPEKPPVFISNTLPPVVSPPTTGWGQDPLVNPFEVAPQPPVYAPPPAYGGVGTASPFFQPSSPSPSQSTPAQNHAFEYSAYAPPTHRPLSPEDFQSTETAPPPADIESWQASPPKRSFIAPTIAFILLVTGAVVWLLQEDLFPPLVVEIPAPTRPTASEAPAPAALQAPASSDDVRKAERPPPRAVDLVAATEVARKLFLDMIAATSPEQRARFIAAPEEHGADAEEFFATHKVELNSFKLSSVTPKTLPGHETVPLFQVGTTTNLHGALLRLVPQQKDGEFLLDWPLFAETHLRKLAAFLEKPPADPAWLHLGVRRSHGLELPESQRGSLVALTLQGSADGSLACLAVAPKNTPAGRYLARETEWNEVYVCRLLLHHRKLEDGTPAVFVLDIEGAATGEAP